jgi:hypothetical protein
VRRLARLPRLALVGVALCLAWAVGLGIAWIDDGGGADAGPAALAIADTEWADPTHVFVYTECATPSHVEVDRSGEIPTVAVWGEPRVGRCREWVLVKVPAGTTKLTDAATSQVVDLDPYAPPPPGQGHGGH